ncbi:MAG: cyclic nucleotide-binding domain-containing protein [Armatimonadetes bacterium]|nr:cyclic nucleotide-binding domain-containing protein [Armatimonadota bacterium]
MNTPAIVKDNPLFSGLNSDQVDLIYGLGSERVFQGGDTVVRQFDRDTDLIIVLQGTAAVKTFSGEVVAEVGPGAVLGEVSLVDSAPRSATVVMKSSGHVVVIPSGTLRETLASHPDLRAAVMENVARILASRLRAANIHMDVAASTRG